MNNDFVFDPSRSADDVSRIKTLNIDPQAGLIKTWSYSSLTMYESCPYKVFLRYVKKIELDTPPPAKRGQEVHDSCEKFVTGESNELHAVASKHFLKKIMELREKYKEGIIQVEEPWAFDRVWGRTDWNATTTWAKMILDVFEYQEGETCAKLRDYKTGKKDGNELKHGDQSLIYAAAVMKRYPQVQYVESEFWYLDVNEVLKKSYTRQYIEMFMPKIEARATALTSANEFHPKPSKFKCTYCDYAKINACPWAETNNI